MFLGLLLGVLGRTAHGWFVQAADDASFLKRYWVSMAAAFLLALYTAASLFNTVQIPDSAGTILAKFLFCIAFGWGVNDLTNSVAVDPTTKPTTPATPTPPGTVTAPDFTVKVVDSANKPVPGAQIDYYNAHGHLREYTDDNGNADLGTDGIARYQVTADGFNPVDVWSSPAAIIVLTAAT